MPAFCLQCGSPLGGQVCAVCGHAPGSGPTQGVGPIPHHALPPGDLGGTMLLDEDPADYLPTLDASSAAQPQPAATGQPAQASPAAPAPQPAAGTGRPKNMTMVAGAAFDLAAAFNEGMANAIPGWQVELAAPQGPSTGGGVQASHALSLISQQQHRLAIGRVDTAAKTASLRGYNAVYAMYQERFGAPLPIDPPTYAQLLETASRFLEAMRYQVTRDNAVAAPPPPPMLEEEGDNRTIYLVLLALLVLGAMLGLAYYYFLR